MENDKVKREAKFLIEKTKKLISSIEDQKKAKSPLNSPKFDSPPLSPSRPCNTLPMDDNLINVSLLDNKVDMKIAIKNMATKIKELTIKNKELEKLSKKKDEMIISLQKKLNSKTEYADELNKKIINELGDDLYVENSKLRRKISALEKTLNENTFMYEEIIKEYKEKVNSYSSASKEKSEKLKDIDKEITKLSDTNIKIQNDLESKKSQIEKYSKICQENQYKEGEYVKRIQQLEGIIKNMLGLVSGLAKYEQYDYNAKKILSNDLRELLK